MIVELSPYDLTRGRIVYRYKVELESNGFRLRKYEDSEKRKQ